MDNKMDNQEEIRLRLVRPDTSTRTELPVATSGVSAGFPSPADDHLDPPLDLNRELVRNPCDMSCSRSKPSNLVDRKSVV